MRHVRGITRESIRSSALWGKKSGGDNRSRTHADLGRRGAAALLAMLVALLLPVAATAAPGDHGRGHGNGRGHDNGLHLGHLDPQLRKQAQDNPSDLYRVIVEVAPQATVDSVASEVDERQGKVDKRFHSIHGLAGRLTGEQLLALADDPGVLSVTQDLPVRSAGDFEPTQLWPASFGADALWSHDAAACPVDPDTGEQVDPLCTPIDAYTAPQAATIAVVDSGIQPNRAADFGARLIASVNVTDDGAATGDQYGHGTFVASLAAGQATSTPGVAPSANLVSVRALDASGTGYTSDVIAAADWILANKDAYGIRVANFSLGSANANSFRFDPLDHAVERLWFAGVTVVASSGNWGNGSAGAMDFAPANDPFVITVGAADLNATASQGDDFTAPWSAFGYTADGFAKPEVSAPGRYLIGAVPTGSTLATERPDHVVSDGYMQLSGTSFATAIVSGAAAQLLALHPDWTPDEVKGALMVSATSLPNATALASGVGETNVAAAAAVSAPPNPNLALEAFVTSDPTVSGGLVFDEASWANTAASDASWANASWANASWANASWANASWANASFASASWANTADADAALADASWANASWANASWANASWANESDLD